MRISFKGDYALKTILDLSVNYKKGLVRISEIAKRQDVPLKYLEQILLLLKGAGYVNSKRGPEGGYFLAKNPSEITVGEIIRLTEGYTSPVSCVSKSCYAKCNDELKCPFRPLWSGIREMINGVVDKVTFEDMRERKETLEKKSIVNYEI
ncbi:MAG: Rrf2 family transcriptional regulator [Candidatus Firestonebacteria bacterium]